MIVRLRYPSAGVFRFDCQTQIAAGGLLVDHQEAGELPAIGACDLEIWIEEALLMKTAAEIVELTETSVQLGLSDEASARLSRACAARFPEVAADGSAAAIASLHPANATAAPHAHPTTKSEREDRETLERRIKQMTAAERVQVALHGGREERSLLLRERIPNVQAALVRNPKLTADELMALARSPHLGAEAAEAIAKHPAWGSSPQVAMALVRNPKTPTPIGLRLIEILQPSDLRLVAKGGAVREQLAAAARKRLHAT